MIISGRTALGEANFLSLGVAGRRQTGCGVVFFFIEQQVDDLQDGVLLDFPTIST